MSKFEVSEGIQADSIELATEVTNCFFRASMEEWAVDCPSTEIESHIEGEKNPWLRQPAQNEGGELGGGETPSTPVMRPNLLCVREKFNPWQFNVLSAFQGYLARLPLQHQQLMVLQHFHRSFKEMLDQTDEMDSILADTTSLQREALKILENTTDGLVALIDDHLVPFIESMPDVSCLDDFVLHLQSYADNTEVAVGIIHRFFFGLIPATSLVLIFINWVSDIPVRYTMPPSLAICLFHRFGLLPFKFTMLGLWVLFMANRLLHRYLAPSMSEEERLCRNITHLLESARQRRGN